MFARSMVPAALTGLKRIYDPELSHSDDSQIDKNGTETKARQPQWGPHHPWLSEGDREISSAGP